jgi:3-oxoacyl-[acyl-carrier protein] reductase
MSAENSSFRPVAVVTGGSRGIGRAVVERLARAGALVRFSYVKSEEAATGLSAALAAEGQDARGQRVDARDAAASRALVEGTIAELGRIDVLVNNAGITADRLLPLMRAEDWTEVLATSLSGLFGTAQPTAKQMMRQRAGRIVNLTSVSGLMGVRGQTNYSAAKAGIIGFTRSLAKELAAVGVPVNAVAPGFIDTDMTGALSEAQRQAAVASVPMRRFGTADEVASLVEWLALRAPTYLTGQVLVLDGGLTS